MLLPPSRPLIPFNPRACFPALGQSRACAYRQREPRKNRDSATTLGFRAKEASPLYTGVPAPLRLYTRVHTAAGFLLATA